MSTAGTLRADDLLISGEAAARGPAMWGVVFAALQAASPVAFWWLDTATVYALVWR